MNGQSGQKTLPPQRIHEQMTDRKKIARRWIVRRANYMIVNASRHFLCSLTTLCAADRVDLHVSVVRRALYRPVTLPGTANQIDKKPHKLDGPQRTRVRLQWPLHCNRDCHAWIAQVQCAFAIFTMPNWTKSYANGKQSGRQPFNGYHIYSILCSALVVHIIHISTIFYCICLRKSKKAPRIIHLCWSSVSVLIW